MMRTMRMRGTRTRRMSRKGLRKMEMVRVKMKKTRRIEKDELVMKIKALNTLLYI